MKLIIAMTTAALFATAIPASAQPAPDAPKASVNYGDLNLSTPAGRAALDRRVERAVAKLCPAPPQQELGRQPSYRACQDGARTSASQEMARIYSGQQLAEATVPAGDSN